MNVPLCAALLASALCVALPAPSAAEPQSRSDGRWWRTAQPAPGGYREPAAARGFTDGYARGLRDGRDRRRYDPVGSRDYREADNGYAASYGSLDAYRTNYRAGFRQGYEEGYRSAARRRP